MWWTVRAIDGVAALALSGVVVGGGLLTFTSVPPDPAPVGVRYPSGPVSTDTVRSAPLPSPRPAVTTRREPEGRPAAERSEPVPEHPPQDTEPEAPAPPLPAPSFIPAPDSDRHAAPPAHAVPAPAARTDAPAPWTAPAPAPAPAPAAATAPSTTAIELVVGSFNVLGTSHTRHGERGFAPGATRAQWAAQLIRGHELDIVGLQELQPDQRGVVTRELGEYDIFPGASMDRHAAVNSVMWRADRWHPVETRTIGIPYFRGQIYQMPYLRLRHTATGAEVWVANFHNPASTRRAGNNARWRAEATEREIALANRLYGETGVPVIFTGDMNERAEYFCPVVAGTDLEASNGGSVDGTRCDPPDQPGIDWIFGTPEIRWSSSVRDRSDLVRRTSDHPVVVARGRLSRPG